MNKLLKEFIFHLEFKESKKYNTIISLKNDIEQFILYFQEKKITNFQDIDILMLREYLNSIKFSGISASTFNRKLSSLKKFYRYLRSKEIISENIVAYFENLKSQEKEIEYLSDEEVVQFRNAIVGNSFNFCRDRLIFELLYSSGLTVAELLALGEKNFNLEKREIEFFKEKNRRFSFFSERCKKAYEEFIKMKKEKFKENNNEAIIFVNNSNERLTDRSLRRLINKYGEKAKIEKEVSPYTIRHTFCMTMLKEGMPGEYLKKMLDMSTKDLLAGYEKNLRKENL